jgi:8-oxo-dGTP pyrophosphatase MutT (NUDIX family)
VIQPLDHHALSLPISVKGVVIDDGHVVLVGNPRDEWELPGGKLERGETPEACVARELSEELAVEVAVGPLLDAWVYDITPEVSVLVLIYGCTSGRLPDPLVSPEGCPVGRFRADALDALPLPAGYRRAITTWFASAAGST